LSTWSQANIFYYLQYILDSCLVGITTSYYSLLVNECLPDYEMISDGEKAKGNYDFAIEPNAVITDQERFDAINFSAQKAINSFIAQIAAEGSQGE